MNDDASRRRILAEGGVVLAAGYALLIIGATALWAVSATRASPNCGQLTCTGWDRIELGLVVLGLPFGLVALLLSTSALAWFARWRQQPGRVAGTYAALIGLAPALALVMLPAVGGVVGTITQSR